MALCSDGRGKVRQFLFGSSPTKFVANHAFTEDAVDASFGTYDPVSCCVDGSFHEDTTLIFDLFMVVSHKELSNVVESWSDDRKLFSYVECCMLEPYPYPQKSLFLYVSIQLS